MAERRKAGVNLKREKISEYIAGLKILIMDEIYFIYGRAENAVEIIAHWFELNEPCSDLAWLQLEKMSLARIWFLMQEKMKIA